VTLGGVSRAQLRPEVKARCFAAACLDVSITRLDTGLGNCHKGSALPRPMRDLRRATLASIWNRDGQQGLAAYSNGRNKNLKGLMMALAVAAWAIRATDDKRRKRHTAKSSRGQC